MHRSPAAWFSRVGPVAMASLFVAMLAISFGDRALGQAAANPQAPATSNGTTECDVACVVTAGLRVVTAWALPLLSALAGIGVVTMALIQAVKDMLPIRRAFHRRALTAWLKARKAGDQEATLLELATGGNANALWDLPLTGLMGQLTTVSRIVLLFPVTYEKLLRVFAGGGVEVGNDIGLIVGTGNTTPEELDRARVRVGHMIERNIDALQISLDSRWEWGNKVWAFAVSGLVTSVAFVVFVYTMNLTNESKLNVTLAMVPVVVLAGFIAPVAKDLVTALQSTRKE
jgi:hypothetical protein